MQARRGELVDGLGDDGLVALVGQELAGHEPVGLLTWAVDDATRAEMRAVAVADDWRGKGVGRALIDAAHGRLGSLGVRCVWLVTTNDNLVALRLYQQLGYRLVALRVGAIDAARRDLKPVIGAIGAHGIPIRDELELEIELPSSQVERSGPGAAAPVSSGASESRTLRK